MSGETVVIGGGLGGLAAAAYLARAGQRVRILEKATVTGGRARSQAYDGAGGEFTFNLGPHALYRRGPAERVLGELGVAIEGGAPTASGALALAGGRTFMFPAGPFSLLATGLLPALAKLEIGRLLATLPRLDAQSLAGTSVATWLDGATKSAESRALVEALVRVSTYTNAPEVLDASVAVTQLQRVAKHGVRYLHRGWQPLVDGLASAAIGAGATIEAGAKAARVVVEGGRARAVELDDGRRIAADRVVVAASPSVASAMFPGMNHLAEAASRAVPVEAACLDVGLSRLPRPRSSFLLGIDTPHYASVHSNVAEVAPPGAATIHVARYLSPGEAAPSEAELVAVLEQLQPGASELIIERRFLPRLVVMHAIVSASGAGFAGRTGVTMPEVDNVALVGDWVGDEGVLADATFASARAAAVALGARSDTSTAADDARSAA